MAEKNESRKPDPVMPDKIPNLRRRAEDKLVKQHGKIDRTPLPDIDRIVQELRVHQIELEMQNEELRRAQHELEASREKYFDLYDLAPVGYFSIDDKGFITEANLALATLLGKERSHLVGQPVTRFIHRKDQNVYFLCHKKLAETQEKQTCEMRMLANDEVPFWVRIDISAARAAEGAATVRAAVIDISESRRLNDSLVTNERKYHLLFENMSEGATYCKMLYDKNGIPADFVYLDVNTAFGHLTGLHSIEGKRVTEAVPGIKDLHPELFEIYGRVATTGRPEKLEIEFKPLDAWLSLSVYSTEKDHFIVIFDNITRRKKHERIIEDLNAQLQDKVIKIELANEALETYGYSVSHDLRAPLRHMSGFADLLLKRLEDRLDNDEARFLTLISDAAKKMDRLILDLLNYSRLGQQELKKSELDLNQLLEETVSQLAIEVKGRDITWNLGKLPVVQGEQALLKLVLVNLISNAVKFTSTRSTAEIEVGFITNQDEDIIFIRDNGVGFSMEQEDRLFGVFQRLHTQNEFEGTGIGLANVRRIIALHGGRTWAEGAVDKGATFYFALQKAEKQSLS